MTPATCPLAASTNLDSSADQILRSKRRFPRHNVILARREEIDRHVDLRQIHRHAALRGLAGLLDVVFEVSVARVPAVHRTWQADAI